MGSLNAHQAITPADDYFQNFCAHLVGKHYFVRSAAIADNVGRLMAAAYRRNLKPLMTVEDSPTTAAQAAIRAATRNFSISNSRNSSELPSQSKTARG